MDSRAAYTGTLAMIWLAGAANPSTPSDADIEEAITLAERITSRLGLRGPA